MKKALSLIIALALVISLIPVTFAAEASTVITEVKEYNYVMKASAFGTSGTFSDTVHSIENNLDQSAPWGYVVHRTGSSYGVYDTSVQWSFKIGQEPPSPYDGTGDVMLGLEIEVKEDGVYSPSISLEKAFNGPILDVYLVKKPEDSERFYKSKNSSGQNLFTYVVNNCINDRLGSIDTCTTGSRIAFTHTFNKTLNLTAGRYFLVIIPNGANKDYVATSDGKGNVYLSGFNLTEVKKPTTSYEYITTFSAFNTSKMLVTSDAAWREKLGFIRSSSGDGNLIHSMDTMNWESVSKVYKNVNGTITETDETFKPMNLSATDPWKMSYSKSTSAPHIKGKYGLYMTFQIGGYHSGQSGPFFSVILRIPNPGTYKLAFKSGRMLDTNVVPAIWFGTTPYDNNGNVYSATPASAASSFITAVAKKLGYVDFRTLSTTEYVDFGEITVSKGGDYYLSFIPDVQSRLYSIKTIDGVDYSDYFDENGNLITGKTTGKASQELYLAGIKLTPVAETAADIGNKEKEDIITEDGGDIAPVSSGVTTTATVSALAAYIDGEEITGEVINVTGATFGKEVTLTAPEKDGYKFLYWAKAGTENKIILSHEKEFSYIPYHGANRVIAVYESKSAAPKSKAEFYNANGQLIKTLTEDGVAPALPKLAGYGDSTGWALYGSNEVISGGAPVTVSGTKLYVAQYNDLESGAIEINVNGDVANYTYGDIVSCSATLRENGNAGSKVFNYWVKDGEIVSFDLNYSFKAFKPSTVTAVYKDYKPTAETLRKIILTEMGDGNVMAEYIGLEDAVEKGIIFEGDTIADAVYKATMNGKGNQFSVFDDVNGSGLGYALFEDGTIIYDK